jgi:Phage tail sheath protein.
MANIPGATNALPGVFTDVITQSRGVSVPGGSRIAAIIGEGSTDETIVSQANGGGQDGLNSTYTSTTGRDGRHFQLLNFPLVSNRTTLFKNGVPLKGLESLIDGNPFSFTYDYRIDISTGKVELQRAHLQDQGGSFYSALSSNVGLGSINNLSLLDPNAPPETWTIRCVKVQRNPLNQPIGGTASFLAFGSVSGAKLDANGNPIVWIANNNIVNNGVLSFSISETTSGPTVVSPFREGDAFTIIVKSGVLVRNDSLTANYIPTINLNDPVLLQGLGDVVKKHGLPSTDNNLSLGAQLAFANSAPAVMAVQAAPSIPRRTSYVLSSAVNSLSPNDDDFIFPLPVGVIPDFNSAIHFFVTNNATNVETQILPNKFAYYLLDTAGNPTTHQFIQDNVNPPGGNSYSYTVKQSLEALNAAQDGYIGRDLGHQGAGVFSTPSVSFDSTYVGKALKIIDTKNSANFGLFHVTAVTGGKLYVVADGSTFAPSTLTANPSYLSNFISEVSGLAYQLIDPVTGLPVGTYAGTDGYVVPVVTQGDGYFKSPSLDFSTVTGVTGLKLKISGSAVTSITAPVGNNGLYDILSVSGSGLVIQKVIVNESGLGYEILDPTATSNYVVVNKNVVPNGYGLRVTIVDSKDATFFDAGWINALASLQKVECDILVPLPKQTISVIFQNALSHCLTMSNIKNKKERVLFIGAINGLTPDNISGITPAAVENIGVLEGIQGETVTDILAGNVEDLANYSVPDAFGNTYRCVYFYPDQIVVQAGTDNVLIDGFYLAAAAAGYAAADVRIENPFTNKVFSGFTILRNKQFSPQTLEQLATAGVTTLQPVSGGGRVVWGITTTQSGFPEEQEISIVFIRDRVAKTLRAGFQGFIGNPESANTGAILNTRGVILLNSLVSQGLITQYADLAVVKDSVDPRQWNVSVRVQPTYPVNFIYIKVSLGQL